ncbi:MAG: hypothetical protein QN152_03115 [Armatimonadota bacterium]|nr:hypothetical protein [Armatimonadota bacterium]MDR7428335.1 hypothetical protein [Armatimonadota bacterium]MDR7463211.1 hypothetical protein [Armatimonadota bacterium]MDR7469409.1 hypothetical protein [Armatimonadota bacterium]MDR7474755.1 hypothetical protein [Armatimonadota bacterium]
MARGRTLYLRGLPELLVREAKATAARRGVTLAALVTEALQQVVGAPVTSGAAAGLAESRRWFEANRHRLLRRYRDRYVAIDRGRVIDHDRDFDALARRVFARVGTRPVFMPKVTAEERVVSVPSPRLIGA